MKVIWAVDPFAPDRKMQFTTFRILAEFTKALDSSIEPVAVLTPDQLRVPRSVFKQKRKAYQLEAETLLESWVRHLDHPRLSKPVLLLQDAFFARPSVDALLQYARRKNAGLIGLGTHAKPALAKLIVGSFAEAMVLKSSTPLLLVNPRSRVLSQIRRILFATDFSQASRKALLRLIPIAKKQRAEIIVYYKFDYVIMDTVAAMRLNPEYSHYLESDLQTKLIAGEHWAQIARDAGVKASLILDESPAFVSEGILKASQKNRTDIIALASRSGPVAAAFLGSVARQVVRSSQRPVWVIHEK